MQVHLTQLLPLGLRDIEWSRRGVPGPPRFWRVVQSIARWIGRRWLPPCAQS
jgi:hypothetical protein